ncbi:MAG: Na+/H+ antiporter NhaC family protein, partial [Gemmatimonadetes bacterium]|nr:Na+/H+ antiporter NhaC family protein [Gemmatimonadota bacterium]
MRYTIALMAALLASVGLAHASSAQQIELDGPDVFLKGVRFPVTVSAPRALEPVHVVVRLGDGTIVADTTIDPLGSITLGDVVVENASQLPIRAEAGGEVVTLDRRLFPGWISILPPLVAVVLALVFREVVTSLVAGIWLGCLFLAGYNPISAIFMAGNRFARGALSDFDNVAIILFSLLLGGMVGVITRMGGTRAIVEAVAPLATNRTRGQLATWLAGLVVFFDDYSNALIVGNTMRPLTDKLKISREKLAY